MINTLSTDPINNAINNGIRRSIELVCENQCYGAAVILIFAGIDAMSHINRPENKDYNDGEDFKIWVSNFFHIYGDTRITPDEWWAARNAIVHTYGAFSKLHEKGIRVLMWMVGPDPNIRYDYNKEPHHVIVDILAMKDAFFKGMERFLIEGFADPTKKNLFEKRINELVITFPDQKKSQNNSEEQ